MRRDPEGKIAPWNEVRGKGFEVQNGKNLRKVNRQEEKRRKKEDGVHSREKRIGEGK